VNANLLMVVLRLIHIICGAFWVGGVLSVAFFILPAQRAIGQPGMLFVRQLMMGQKFRSFMIGAAVLTILSGLTIYIRYAKAGGGWAQSNTGIILGVGAVAAIIAAGIGTGYTGKIGKKMLELGGAIQETGGPPTDTQKVEMDALQGKMQTAFRIVAILLLIAVAAMASARYL
jgi:uncharacterized membrane protein